VGSRILKLIRDLGRLNLLPIADSRFADCRLPIHGLPIADCRLPIADSRFAVCRKKNIHQLADAFVKTLLIVE
jgi:hypothetical protein